MAGLIAIRTAAVGRAMEVPQVILRAIDGQVKWDPSCRDPGDFGRLRSVHSTESTDQSEMSTECTLRVFNKSIRIALFLGLPNPIAHYHGMAIIVQLGDRIESAALTGSDI